nr:serine/threonine protein kinase [Deltaproteobacteria bacterium]
DDKDHHDSLVGNKVDGYTIEGVIGGGSFGTVYRGRQHKLDRVVALKVPTYEIASDPVMSKRFAREAKAAAAIHHPGVVSIYAVGDLPDGRPYLAMEFVEGQPLDRILDDGPVPVLRALGIVRQIASALSETHVVGVVHRDLKPSNIMWRRDRNGDDRITIVDFGIALCKPGTAEATRLTANNLIGTPHYMSPEQAHGEVVDARADLYALGCVTFELITGSTPFDGSGFEVLLAHLGRPVPRPSDRNPDVPENVDRLVLALMAKRPSERIASADTLVGLIDDTVEALESLDLPDPPKSARRPKRKTAATKKDRPMIPIPRSSFEPQPLDPIDRPAVTPSQRTRWMAIGAALAFVLSAAGVVAVRLIVGHDVAADRLDDTREPAAQVRREIFRDDGSLRLRAYVPDPMIIGQHLIWLELRNKLGAVIKTDQLIVIVEDPQGSATATVARPRSSNPEQFAFAFDYKQPGIYQVRIFPPENAARSSSTFAIPIDVSGR